MDTFENKENENRLKLSTWNKKLQDEMDRKQKTYLEKEEKGSNIWKKWEKKTARRGAKPTRQKRKILHILSQNEIKMKDRISTFYRTKQEKEERFEKREQERLDELKHKYEEKNKIKNERLQMALKRDEEMKKKIW